MVIIPKNSNVVINYPTKTANPVCECQIAGKPTLKTGKVLKR